MARILPLPAHPGLFAIGKMARRRWWLSATRRAAGVVAPLPSHKARTGSAASCHMQPARTRWRQFWRVQIFVRQKMAALQPFNPSFPSARSVNVADRKSVVWGKRGAVRVDSGGRRYIKKKKEKKELEYMKHQKT